MLVLAIDTATHDLVTGLVETSNDPAAPAVAGSVDKILPAIRGHNEFLVPTIQELLAENGHSFADLGAIVVGHGPGPFTGLRVGMATASAIGQALRIPVHGVSTLDAIASRHDAARLLVTTDARRREVYFATYRDGERTSGPSVAKPADLDLPHEVDAIVAPEHLREQLREQLPEALAALEPVELTPRALGLVSCADFSTQPEPLTPAYLRRPDAVEPAAVPRSAAIPEVK